MYHDSASHIGSKPILEGGNYRAALVDKGLRDMPLIWETFGRYANWKCYNTSYQRFYDRFLFHRKALVTTIRDYDLELVGLGNPC